MTASWRTFDSLVFRGMRCGSSGSCGCIWMSCLGSRPFGQRVRLACSRPVRIECGVFFYFLQWCIICPVGGGEFFVIFLTISSAITGLPSDRTWFVLVWQGKGSSSLILVHVLWWRNLRSSAMNLFISVTGRPSVRSKTWLPTDLAIVCLFTFTFHILPGFKFGRFLSKTASFVCCSRGACFHQLWSSPVCFSYFLEVAPTVFIAAVALSSPRTIGLVVNMGLAPSIWYMLCESLSSVRIVSMQ